MFLGLHLLLYFALIGGFVDVESSEKGIFLGLLL